MIMMKREVIFKTAFISRLIIFFIQFISNLLIPDHEADAYQYPKSETYGIGDLMIGQLFGGFVRWDAQHFMHIAKYGYSFEHTVAFFPLLPYTVRIVATNLNYIIPFIDLDSIILLIFCFLNSYCFVQSALCLYELSLNFMSENLAYKSSILFCFNPASIFFSAPYTESLFCYFTFKSILNCVLLYKKYHDSHQNLQLRDVVYIIPICLSTCTRSNGVLNIGFLVYTLVCLFCDKINKSSKLAAKTLYSAKFFILTLSLIFICMIPFILFQLYCYNLFCKDSNVNLPKLVLKHKDIETFVLPGSFSKHNQSWCYKTVPLAYKYVQSHYWEVGFLQYYELKQIPNFLLASPIVFLLLSGAFKFFKNFPKKVSMLFNFNLILHKPSMEFGPVWFAFVVHSTMLTIFCILNIHVQVTTRMLCSASPVLYWFCAYYISDIRLNSVFKQILYRKSWNVEYFLLVYFLSYFVIGTILFSNFFPWT